MNHEELPEYKQTFLREMEELRQQQLREQEEEGPSIIAEPASKPYSFLLTQAPTRRKQYH